MRERTRARGREGEEEQGGKDGKYCHRLCLRVDVFEGGMESLRRAESLPAASSSTPSSSSMRHTRNPQPACHPNPRLSIVSHKTTARDMPEGGLANLGMLSISLARQSPTMSNHLPKPEQVCGGMCGSSSDISRPAGQLLPSSVRRHKRSIAAPSTAHLPSYHRPTTKP